MDINSLFGFDRGANKEAAEYALQNDGQISLNPIQRLFGADEKDVQNILDRRQQKSLTDQYGALGASAGLALPGADWGESQSQYLARINRGKEAQTNAQEAKLRGYKKEDAKTALTQATTLKSMDLQAGRDQYNATLQSQNNRYAHERSEARLDRGLERELSGAREDLQMQMAMMNNELSEKRMAYDRETRSMDRRDKRIAQLLAGLGQLGGAFSM